MKAKMVWLLSIACWSGIDFSLGEMLLRVADYNIKFLSVEDLDAKPQRKQRLKTVIEQLKPDILALQEIKDRQALEQLFDSDEWSILIDDDSNDAQDLAIVVRRPLKFKDRTDLDADDADFLFPGPTFENLFRNRTANRRLTYIRRRVVSIWSLQEAERGTTTIAGMIPGP